MSINVAQIGATYYMGNTFNPEACTVAYRVGFVDLSERDQRAHETLGRQHGYDPRAVTYIGFYESRKHGSEGGAAYRVLPEDVFCGCAYVSLDAMVSDRVAKQGPANPFAGAQLPGGR